MNSAQESERSSETVILPDHPVFEKQPLPWTHLFELARLFQACNKEQQEKVKLESWVDLAAKTDNPADLRDLLLTDRQDGRVPSIGLGVKEMFKRTEKKELPLLQQLVGCSIHLKPPKDNVFIPRLNPLDLVKPNQLNRTYGADRFINLKISDQLSNDLRSRGKQKHIHKCFEKFIHTPMRIGNRQFFVFLRKENFIWLVSVPKPGWESTKNFINEILDLNLNKEMTVAKWAARTSLVLSATRSSIDVDPQDIRRVPDIYSDSLIISRDLLCSVADTLGLSYLPSCIEGLVRNKPFVWRLGVPAEDERYLIQLWDDQIGKASKHVFIKFRVRRYDHFQQRFALTEESIVVLLEKCFAMGARPQGEAEIMTDGAGIISRTAAARVCESLGRKYDTLPSAYQARIGFAKGLWILPPELHTLDFHPWIEIRDSQWKAETAKGHHFHFNVNRISRSVASGTLGKQLLPILAARGVRADTVCAALKEHIDTTMSDLNSNDPLKITECLTRSGALRQGRSGILNRTAGIQHDPSAYRSFRDNIADPYFNSEYNTSWEMTKDNLNGISLTPNQLEEQVVSMLTAGFEPRNRYIVMRLRTIKEERIKTAINFKVPIAQSTFVYVIPDPTGTLKEDEAFLQFSDFRDESMGVKIPNLICPALVSRFPCVSSTDARKVNMVDNKFLRETYFDVMVCSIQGKPSLLSLLSGGDYDGDQVTVVWNPVLVQEFHNINMENYQRVDVDKLFEPVQLGTVKECLLEAYESNAERFVKLAQSIQIAGLLTPNDTGFFCVKHTMAEYVFGLEDPLTQTLGEVYVKCLDAPKAGLKLKDANVQLLTKEFKDALCNVTLPGGKKITKFTLEKELIPKYLAKNPKFDYGEQKTKPILFQFEGKAHILDKLFKTGHAILKFYQGQLELKDDATHKARFKDRDEDVPRYFVEKMDESHQTEPDQGGRDIRIGVLRPLKRCILEIAKDWTGAFDNRKNSDERDRIWESRYGPGTGVTDSGKNRRLTSDAQKKYEELSYENALEYVPESEEIALHKIDLEKFQKNIRLFLEGLGPIGYALLKASCISKFTNPESFCPFDLAFREVCYLKAMASQTKKTNNSTLNHFPTKEAMDLMGARPPRGITTTAYLTSVVKAGMIQGRSENEDQNLEPI